MYISIQGCYARTLPQIDVAADFGAEFAYSRKLETHQNSTERLHILVIFPRVSPGFLFWEANTILDMDELRKRHEIVRVTEDNKDKIIEACNSRIDADYT